MSNDFVVGVTSRFDSNFQENYDSCFTRDMHIDIHFGKVQMNSILYLYMLKPNFLEKTQRWFL